MNTDRPHDGCGHKQPPEDQSRNLVTFDRRKNGVPEQLRIGLDSYKGYDYVSLRVWSQALDGSGLFWPSKVGSSIRRSEVLEAIRALEEAARLLGLTEIQQTPQEGDRPTYLGPVGGRRRVDEAELRRLSDHYQATRTTDAKDARS